MPLCIESGIRRLLLCRLNGAFDMLLSIGESLVDLALKIGRESVGLLWHRRRRERSGIRLWRGGPRMRRRRAGSTGLLWGLRCVRAPGFLRRRSSSVSRHAAICNCRAVRIPTNIRPARGLGRATAWRIRLRCAMHRVRRAILPRCRTVRHVRALGALSLGGTRICVCRAGCGSRTGAAQCRCGRRRSRCSRRAARARCPAEGTCSRRGRGRCARGRSR